MYAWIKNLIGGTSKQQRTTRSTGKLQVEHLETRELMAADWFATNLHSTAVANLVRADWNNHGSVNYNDMLNVYKQVAKDGLVDAPEYQSLKFLAADASGLKTPGSVGFLESQVVGQNAANALFDGRALGNLHSGSSGSQLQLLVDKWFLGQDHPDTVAGLRYTPVSGSLFGSGGPSFADVSQGGAGDCALLASFAEVAAREPSVIQSMFTADGNNVWTVRFYENGAPVYVTVDNDLPINAYGQFYYDQPQNGVLWVALAEKAYAELNAFDAKDGYTVYHGVNTYTSATNGLNATQVLNTLTNQSSYTGTVAQALSSGKLIVLGSDKNTGTPYVVGDHAYAVLGYDASNRDYILFNPWGLNNCQREGVYGEFYASAAYLEEYFAVAGYQTASLADASISAPATQTQAFDHVFEQECAALHG